MSNIASKIVPLLNRVLVKRVVPTKKTSSGILLPDSHKDAVKTGTVFAVGPGAPNKSGVVQPLNLKVGEVVVMPEYGGTVIKEGEAEFVLLREEELLAKISE
eukprot:CAMPEP_0116917972 /NCGR_PEP_ID=MMETSP0467-20121206/19478_1 /TAXON_ID=283647 /ORGANISM="Mesodinium pulex, Strain SPMC105" /LENGTH=101 /DNA_ID=CAMNT_0004595201 /DNA_START=43 /DNA_END=348 /DNA_ORIENTATION=+